MRPSPFNKASGSSKAVDGDKAPAPAPMPALSEESSEVCFCPSGGVLSIDAGPARPRSLAWMQATVRFGIGKPYVKVAHNLILQDSSGCLLFEL